MDRKPWLGKRPTAIVCLFLMLPFQPLPLFGDQALELDSLVARAIEKYASINDYTCRFNRKESVGRRTIEDRSVVLKYRKPGEVHLRWTEGKSAGIEMIYAKGKHEDKAIVHLNGFFSFVTVSLDPAGRLAMRSTRHPITEAGIGFILQVIRENYLRARMDPDCSIRMTEELVVGGRTVIPVKAILPSGKGYYGHVIELGFDRELSLPTTISVHGWNNEFLEAYSFYDIKTDVGLTDIDFDTRNPDYHF